VDRNTQSLEGKKGIKKRDLAGDVVIADVQHAEASKPVEFCGDRTCQLVIFENEHFQRLKIG